MQANWDIANLTAAQQWNCPCSDRRNCIGEERGIAVLQLYEHRKQFLTTCKQRGGMRDAFCKDLLAHYSASSRSFSRSFVVGPLNDCCAAAAGLAAGLSVFQCARRCAEEPHIDDSARAKAEACD